MKSGRNDAPKAVNRARRLRAEMNLVEKAIWFRISNSQTGFRFRRQYPAGPYVLDFYCPKVRLAVEIDGPYHELHRRRDEARDKHLNELGISVLRVPADLAYWSTDSALDLIVSACQERS